MRIKGLMIISFVQFEEERLPIIQKIILSILSLFNIINKDTKLDKKRFTEIPIRRMLVFENIDLKFAILKTIIDVINEPINANIEILPNPRKFELMPVIMAMVAPKIAPDEIPIIYGSTKGFLKIDCNEAPEADNPKPIKIPSKILGILT